MLLLIDHATTICSHAVTVPLPLAVTSDSPESESWRCSLTRTFKFGNLNLNRQPEPQATSSFHCQWHPMIAMKFPDSEPQAEPEPEGSLPWATNGYPGLSPARLPPSAGPGLLAFNYYYRIALEIDSEDGSCFVVARSGITDSDGK